VALLKDRARSMALDLAEDFNTATAAGAETFLLSKRHRFLSFPYVCPEPVLEK
jgi:hypothetical protein